MLKTVPSYLRRRFYVGPSCRIFVCCSSVMCTVRLEAYVKQVVGMNDVAAQPNPSDDFCKFERDTFCNSLKRKADLHEI